MINIKFRNNIITKQLETGECLLLKIEDNNIFETAGENCDMKISKTKNNYYCRIICNDNEYIVNNIKYQEECDLVIFLSME